MIATTRLRMRWWVAVTMAGALVLGACGNDTGDSGGQSAADEPAEGERGEAGDEPARIEPELFEGDGDFYAVPDPLPDGEPGALLRYERLGEELPGAVSWRVMYLSESIQGEPIAVTGKVWVPVGDPPDAGHGVVALAQPVNAIADECAPSKDDAPVELAEARVEVVTRSVAASNVVAMTDYEGMGTPGRHPYLVGESEGRGVLDAAKAAAQLPDLDLSDQLAILGGSHGGFAALWAQQIADEWAPEFDVVGAAVGEPVTELSTAMTIVPNVAGGRFMFMLALGGYAEAYPQADPSLLLTPEGVEASSVVDEGCFDDVLAHFASEKFGDILKADPTTVEPWATLWEENSPGQVRTDTPLLITYSDPIVEKRSETLFARLCDLGQVAELRAFTEGRGHVEHLILEFPPAAAKWIDARFAGEAPASHCEDR